MINTLAFFVDSENVGWHGVKDFENLSKNDIIYYFSTASHDKDMVCYRVVDFLDLLLNVKCKFEHVFLDTKSISNYMDDCIKTEIGRVFALHDDVECIIVSKDKGYQACVEYWKNQGRAIFQVENIAEYLSSAGEETISSIKSYQINTPEVRGTVTQPTKATEKKPEKPRPLTVSQAEGMLEKILKQILPSISDKGCTRVKKAVAKLPNKKAFDGLLKNRSSFKKIFESNNKRKQFYEQALPIMERVWN